LIRCIGLTIILALLLTGCFSTDTINPKNVSEKLLIEEHLEFISTIQFPTYIPGNPPTYRYTMNSVSFNEGKLSHVVQFFLNNNNEDDEMSYTVVNHHSFSFFDSQLLEERVANEEMNKHTLNNGVDVYYSPNYGTLSQPRLWKKDGLSYSLLSRNSMIDKGEHLKIIESIQPITIEPLEFAINLDKINFPKNVDKSTLLTVNLYPNNNNVVEEILVDYKDFKLTISTRPFKNNNDSQVIEFGNNQKALYHENEEKKQKLLEWSDGNFSFELKAPLHDGVTKEELIKIVNTMHDFD
jgi:hypothetical protein